MGAEYVRDVMRETCNTDTVLEYVQAARSIQTAIGVFIDPGQLDPDSTQPSEVAKTLDPQRPATKAAMMDGAISLRGYLYQSKRYLRDRRVTFSSIWQGTPLEALAEKCEGELSDVHPQLEGRFTHISLDGMERTFNENLAAGAPEHIVATGLNGAGKTTVLKSFEHFTKLIGIKTKIVHFPRYNGPLGSVFQQVLSGKQKYNPDAFQILAVSDVLDSPPKPNTLMLYDRHATVDSLVFNQKGALQTTILAAREMLEGNLWTVIIDRHPINTLKEIEQRDRSPRIFEDAQEKVLDQFVGFAKLTALPGTLWINNDIPTPTGVNPNWPIEMSMRRFFGAIFSSGILQRKMMKSDLAENHSQANDFLAMSFFQYLEMWREKNS